MNNQIIQSNSYPGDQIKDGIDQNGVVYPGECHMLFNTYCINESTPIDMNCHKNWMYRDKEQMVEYSLTIKVTCQGMLSCI